ncbi:hypothetical protein RB653_004163 [Dictyostelium firmibasis]|uniref:NADH:flavin oxidoreductase/NADH oxidase N-terminal domain-containing protein n=1 Tax=Dictyostelium firmibasis TaxID=79012 RepID=A0AAN7U5Q6_9MYCE
MEEFNYPFKYPNYYKGPGIPIPGEKKIPKAFTPVTINNLKLKNRVVVSPMCQYSCSNNSGLMNDWHLVHYSTFAKGGASLIIFESTAVQKEGRISFADAGIWNDSQIAPMKRICDLIHTFDSYVGMQLAHAGRKASTIPPFLEGSRNSIMPNDPSGNGWQVFGPSPIAYSDYMMVPKEMTKKDIKDTIEAFRQSTIRCIECGFDFIEIHCAHGYLLNQFLSPTSNKRTDEYGGSFENRIRIVLEIIDAVRSVWSRDKALGVRLSCVEWTDDGWNMDETIKFTKVLRELGTIDLIDCSSGGNNHNQKIKVCPMYQVPFADSVKKTLNEKYEKSNVNNKIKVATVGLINHGEEIESILQEDRADIVMCARSFLRNPLFVCQVARELDVEIDHQLQYQRGRESDDRNKQHHNKSSESTTK